MDNHYHCKHCGKVLKTIFTIKHGEGGFVERNIVTCGTHFWLMYATGATNELIEKWKI